MNERTAVFSVQDIRREGCMTLIHDDVEETDGVISAEIDFGDTSISVTFDGEIISASKLMQVMRETGSKCAGHEHTIILRSANS